MIFSIAYAQEDTPFSIKIIVIIIFLRDQCPGTSIDRDISGKLLIANGLSKDDAKNDPIKNRQFNELLRILIEIKPQSCEYFWNQYGSNGTVLKGLATRP